MSSATEPGGAADGRPGADDETTTVKRDPVTTIQAPPAQQQARLRQEWRPRGSGKLSSPLCSTTRALSSLPFFRSSRDNFDWCLERVASWARCTCPPRPASTLPWPAARSTRQRCH